MAIFYDSYVRLQKYRLDNSLENGIAARPGLHPHREALDEK